MNLIQKGSHVHLSTAMSRFMLLTYFVASIALKQKKISVSSSKAEVFLGIRLVFEPNDYHCSKRVHFTAEYVFFSGFGLLLSFILVDNEGGKIKKKKKKKKKNYFPALATSFFSI